MKTYFAPVALALSLFSPPARSQTRVHIQASESGATIDKNVYGQFAEHLGKGIYEGVWVGEASTIPNTRGFRNDVLDALKELRVPVIRWPGGCFADQYHWRDGIGPKDRRKRTVNAAWGGTVEDNTFGTHEFFELVELLGADAYVNINVGTGSPREMVEWLEYITSDSSGALANMRRRNGRKEPWRLHYVGIGNEMWGCGGSMTPEYYANVFKQYATFVKTPAKNRPVVIASGGQNEETNWTSHLLANVQESWTLRMGGISHHYYTLPTGNWDSKGTALGFAEEQWFSTLFRTLKIRNILASNVRIMDKLDPEKKVGFFLDEWGTWYDEQVGAPPLMQQNSLRDAIVAALNFHVFHDFAERVAMTNIAQMVNVLQAMILTDGPRMLRTPTYHAYRLYRPFQGARKVSTAVRNGTTYRQGAQSIPKVSVTAARATNGKLYVGLINSHPRESEKVMITEASTISKASGAMLTASRLDAHNTFDDPQNVAPVHLEIQGREGRIELELPAKSVSVFALE